MIKAKITYKLVVLIVAALFGLGLSAPSLFNMQSGSKITLGLDLQGGLHMLLGVQTESAIESKIKSVASSIAYFTNKNDILIDGLKLSDGFVRFSLLDSDDAPKIDEELGKIAGLMTDKKELNYELWLSDEEKLSTSTYSVEQAV